ncbi:MAG: hypothetical protein J7M29_06415 [Verrucomicrobia bacterium]|nr:hypothetical protein [Verrucomicrobiota bacterium]
MGPRGGRWAMHLEGPHNPKAIVPAVAKDRIRGAARRKRFLFSREFIMRPSV